MTAYVIPNAILVTTYSSEYTFASFLTRDTVYDVMQSLWHPVKPPADQIADQNNHGDGDAANEDATDEGDGTPGHQPTECACGKEGQHYPTPVIDTVIPGTPEKIYELMFKSQFMSDFLSVDQKLMGMLSLAISFNSTNVATQRSKPPNGTPKSPIHPSSPETFHSSSPSLVG
jgi:hypothetical protein